MSNLVDLTFENTETVNGAIFSTEVGTVGAGTGLIDPFLRISSNDETEQGYNTDATTDNEPDPGNVILDNAGVGGSNFVHALKITDLPIEIIGGVGYYRFELDINQLNADDEKLLSLNALQLWQSTNPALNSYVPGATPDQGTGAFPAGDATLIYNLDDGGDKFIGLNGELQAGSGNTVDLSALFRVDLFDPSKPYIYLYSAFGYEPGTYVSPGDPVDTDPSAWTNNDGFEEWVTQIGQVLDGYKFEDLDRDGVWDQPPEPALNGWTVYIDVDNDNVRDAGEPFTLTGTTDINGDGDTTDANEIGYYRFFVTPGTYTIREELQADWIQTAPTPVPPGEWSVTLAEGQSAHNLNFGNFHPLPPQATLTGYKWGDTDADGVWDAGESGLSGWTIYLDTDFDPGNGVVSDVTDAQGLWTINTTLALNTTYHIYEALQGGYTNSYDGNGAADTFGVDIVVDSLGNVTSVPVGAVTGGGGAAQGAGLQGQAVPLNFGNYQNATKSGTKFNDLDGDGVRDGGEPGLAGWTINLVGTAGDGSAVSLSTTTDANGDYSFNVKPGTYTVSEVLQSGWVQTYPDTVLSGDVGDNDGGATDGDWDVVLTSGQVDSGNDFGNWVPGQGALTPGFWCNHLWAWDGDPNTDGQVDGQGRSLASKLVEDGVLTAEDVLIPVDSDGDGDIDQNDQAGVLVGDENRNGVQDGNETVLFIDLECAQLLVCADNQLINKDAMVKLARAEIAAQLNINNGAAAPAGLVIDGAEWLIDNGAGDPTANPDFWIADCNNNGFAAPDVRSRSAAWQDEGEGSDIFTALQAFNESGNGSDAAVSDLLFTSEDGTQLMHAVVSGGDVMGVEITQNTPDAWADLLLS